MAVQYCFACNRLVYDRASYEHELDYLKAWGRESGRRPMYLWLYYTFPWEVALNGKFNCFPGFFAHAVGEQFKLFDRDGYRGFFHCGYGQDVEAYVTYKLMDDPRRDVDRLLAEYFSGLYGAAAEPMRQFYLEVERIYCDPRNYPPEVASGRKEAHTHQTDEIAWRWLGTAERMQRLAGFMAAAKTAADTPAARQRVALFESGIWNYMLAGRTRYQERLRAKASLPLPELRIPRLEPAGGDPARIDWTKSAPTAAWRTTMGNAAGRHIEARLAHDGTFLYVRLQETDIPGPLKTDQAIYSGDDWELFFAPARNGRYTCPC